MYQSTDVLLLVIVVPFAFTLVQYGAVNPFWLGNITFKSSFVFPGPPIFFLTQISPRSDKFRKHGVKRDIVCDFFGHRVDSDKPAVSIKHCIGHHPTRSSTPP